MPVQIHEKFYPNKILVPARIIFRYLLKCISAPYLFEMDRKFWLPNLYVELKKHPNYFVYFQKNLQLPLFTLGGVLKTKKAIKWMNTFDLAKSKEKERRILNSKGGNYFILITICLVKKID